MLLAARILAILFTWTIRSLNVLSPPKALNRIPNVQNMFCCVIHTPGGNPLQIAARRRGLTYLKNDCSFSHIVTPANRQKRLNHLSIG